MPTNKNTISLGQGSRRSLWEQLRGVLGYVRLVSRQISNTRVHEAPRKHAADEHWVNRSDNERMRVLWDEAKALWRLLSDNNC